MLNTKRLFLSLAFVATLLSVGTTHAQVVFSPVFSQVRLEARGDFDYQHIDAAGAVTNPYGFHGKYFNFIVGGDLNSKFSYFFRQRIQATPGSVSLFDNTDFLYLNYKPNEHWMLRLGKDALAVGGFEYDAAPIDVLFSTVYWNNFYCFQLGAAAAYKWNDGKQMLLAQVANSPSVYYGAQLGTGTGNEWRSGLLAYSLFWSGDFGHFKTLYSANMFQRPDKGFMNYIALGHKLVYDRWDIYLDLIHHAVATDDWGKNYAIVSCLNFLVADDLNLFVKGAYEQNKSEADLLTTDALDCLIPGGTSYATYGIGFEYKPSFCTDVRLHGFVAGRTQDDETGKTNTLTGNIGITWHMNIHRMFRERGL